MSSSGTGSFPTTYPALKRSAKLFRPSRDVDLGKPDISN